MTTGKTLDVSYLVWLIFNGKWNRSFISLSSLDKKEYYKLINQMEEWDLHMGNLVDHCNSKVLAKSYNAKKIQMPMNYWDTYIDILSFHFSSYKRSVILL